MKIDKSHWSLAFTTPFPQIAGLGFSDTSKFYALQDREEAQAYFEHPVLGPRLIEISSVLLELDDNDATRIFGSPDDLKLKSSMTLFSELTGADPVFSDVLTKFFNGIKDWETLRILKAQ